MDNIEAITIRDVTRRDVGKIRNFIYTQWQENYTDVPPKTLKIIFDEFQSRDKLDKILRNSQNASLVLVKDEQIKGVVILATEDSFNLELESLYIVPELQGSGFGKKLFEKALLKFPKWKEIKVRVKAENYIGINFYKKLGFRVFDTSSEFIKDYNAKVVFMKLAKSDYQKHYQTS